MVPDTEAHMALVHGVERIGQILGDVEDVEGTVPVFSCTCDPDASTLMRMSSTWLRRVQIRLNRLIHDR